MKDAEEIPEQVDVIGVVYDFQDVYSGSRGQVHIVNVNGTEEADKIKEENPEISERVERLSTFN